MNYMTIRECVLNEAAAILAIETHIRGRQRHPVVHLLMAGPLSASSESFVGLDVGAQTCVRVIVLPLNAIGNNPRKVFRRLDAGRSNTEISNLIPAHREARRR